MDSKKEGYELAKLILLLKDDIKESPIFKKKKLEIRSMRNDKEKIEYVKKLVADILSSAYTLSAEEYLEILESEKIEVVIVKNFCEDVIYFH